MWFVIIISFVVLQRLLELVIAKRNEKWLKQKGAIEYGKEHYPLIVMLHTAFIVSLIGEYLYRNTNIDLVFFIVWIILIAIKIWIISSLGKYWNTKIFRVPGAQPVKKGLYK